MNAYRKKPEWLKVKITAGAANHGVEELLKDLSLNTICREANCPNRMECYHNRTATFMILGRFCTRNCTFCNVLKGRPEKVDPGEPARIAEAVGRLGLRHTVITSVTRDDLPDGGAGQFADVITAVRKRNPQTTVEVLVPDFKLNEDAIRKLVEAKPDVINHNIETVPSLYKEVRPMAVYERSLALLRKVKILGGGILTKSGIMLGLGETRDEVERVLRDLRRAGCDILTIGQYLAPSSNHHPVVEYVHPETFQKLKALGMEMGFLYVASSPLVRSSYHAGEVFKADAVRE
ncbi:lipoate synthase [Ruminococcaceae bacterium BL-6]|nr:lipoate synthase [Ruminococcaceae bacterium BL-6]